MKKINESELLNRVARLREKVLAEMGGGGSAQAQRNANVPATGNSFDAKLNALGKPATTAAAPLTAEPLISVGKSQRTVAAQKDMNAAKTTTASKTTSTAGNAQPNPTVTAYQNWLNQNGQKVEVDGHFGDATDTAAKALLADKAKMADPKVLAAWNDFQGKLNAGFKDGSIIRYPGKMGYAQPTPTKTEPTKTEPANKMTPDEQAARDKAGDMSEPDVVVPQSAPVVNNGPWPAGSPQADAYSKMSPEDQKWLGGADPLDPYILARAPNKGQPATPAQKESVGYDELQRLTSLVHYR